MKSPWKRTVAYDHFVELTRPLIGLPVSHSWRGHGSALLLELGRLRRVASTRLAREARRPINPKGEAGVMLEWSWRVEGARSIQVGSWSSDRRIDTGIAALTSRHVIDIRVEGRLPELIVGLSVGRWLRSFMTAEGQPAWTVFLRDGSWLTVERGRMIHNTQNHRRGRQTSASS
jgi:hypothetical protein